ncbi:Maf-like protein [Agrobacterium vitis]|uniref:Maf-like protein n=1 Tax=Agrobacterium vitis TaxID=373 RepID=UPI0008722ED5|nr:Maf-like protein [Agrobacterium vitis]MCE6075053.1 Maf-like protein [Agrobacterium vitis]MCF1469066.1 Maf-like protein [Agrobacterium vitis]MCM2453086.1 Maf-like protein [Agrobacterium vitis]MCM2467541.1 Maf-like protein [Agrobacterium vitis]MUO68554.1 Maf-like protein [Agrobacterium vitis]
MAGKRKLILASGSPRRVELLRQVGLEADRLMPMDLDESPLKNEQPRSLARRLATDKAKAALEASADEADWKGAFILAADTVVAVGRRVLSKTEYSDEAIAALNLVSGRNHWVFTGVCLITPDRKIRQKVVESKVRFKRLSEADINAYILSGEWRGKAGAYAIQGIAGSFVQKLVGSYSNVVGLPLYETVQLLAGEGMDVQARWSEG